MTSFAKWKRIQTLPLASWRNLSALRTQRFKAGYTHKAIGKCWRNGYPMPWLPPTALLVSVCQSLLLQPRKELLEILVTDDDSWIRYKNEKRMGYWLPREEDPPAQPKAETHGQKVLLCCWWDSQGIVHHELLSQGHTEFCSVRGPAPPTSCCLAREEKEDGPGAPSSRQRSASRCLCYSPAAGGAWMDHSLIPALFSGLSALWVSPV